MRGIIRYTRKQWGNAQVRRYVAALEQGIARLAARQGVLKDMDALYQYVEREEALASGPCRVLQPPGRNPRPQF